MKKLLFVAVMFMLPLALTAQPGHGSHMPVGTHEITFIAQGHEQFVVSVDGRKQNGGASSNVTFSNLRTGRHTVKVELRRPERQTLSLTVDLQRSMTYQVSLNRTPHGNRLSVEPVAMAVNPTYPMPTIPAPPAVNATYQQGYQDGYRDGYRAATQQMVPQTPVPPQPVVVYPDGVAVDDYVATATPQEVARMVAELRQQSFDDTRLTLAKTMVKSKPMLSDDISKLMATFTFEDNKLEFAKYAYSYVYDPENYFHLTSNLTYESSKTTLLNFIRTHTR